MLRVDDVLGSLSRDGATTRALPRSHPRPGDGDKATASFSPDPALLYKSKIYLVLKMLFGSLMESLEAPFSAIVVTYLYRATTALTEISLALSSIWVCVMLTDGRY